MTTRETAQFTVRLDARMLATIKRLAEREAVSINEKLNEVVTLGLITLAARRKKATATTVASKQPYGLTHGELPC